MTRAHVSPAALCLSIDLCELCVSVGTLKLSQIFTPKRSRRLQAHCTALYTGIVAILPTWLPTWVTHLQLYGFKVTRPRAEETTVLSGRSITAHLPCFAS